MGNAMSEGSGGCPVKHDAEPHAAVATTPSSSAPSGCPVNHGESKQTGSSSSVSPVASGCPVIGHDGKDKKDRGVVYNVYAQPIDPTNQMPAVAAQNKAPGQVVDLPTDRVKSSIPKGGTESTWLYPSPQMFWNALVRKAKADGVHETDMPTVVSIHNEMNERAWRKLVEWEDRHKSEHLDGEPSLRRFMGKPHDLSPKAKLKSYLGYGFPFDRHDWYVDRGGKEVRYVIDYYYNPDSSVDVSGGPVGSGESELVPRMTKSIHVDVRPAVDDVTSIIDRLAMFPKRFFEHRNIPKFRAEGLDPAKAPKEAAAFALHSSDNLPKEAAKPVKPVVSKLEQEFNIMDQKCKPLLEKFKAAEAVEDKQNAHVALNYCMASVICPNEAKTFLDIMERKSSPEEEEASFTAMSKCVLGKMVEHRKILSQVPAAPQGTGGAANLK